MDVQDKLRKPLWRLQRGLEHDSSKYDNDVHWFIFLKNVFFSPEIYINSAKLKTKVVISLGFDKGVYYFKMN